MAALGLERFEVRLNNRLLLNGVLEQFGMADKADPVLRTLDKLPKIGRDKTREEMVREADITNEQADKVLDLASAVGANRDILAEVERSFGSNARTAEGVARLRQLLDVAARAGIGEERLRIDLSICRGLDYYTGVVYETFLSDLPDIGSVCSGGRYDDLAQLYTKERLPGVGASLGLDRLLAAMEELKLIATRGATAPVFLPFFAAERLPDYLRLAARLRAAGLGVELYPEPKKLGAQLKYADRRGFRFALILGGDEWENRRAQVKSLTNGETRQVPLEDAAGALHPDLLAALR
jgi:histidyl-tRNA synthetase